MTEKYYLSEVFSLPDFSKEKINLLPQNTGAGKTQLAFKLINSIPNAKSLYVIDTTAGKESLLDREDTYQYSEIWQKYIEDKVIFLDDLNDEEIAHQIEVLFYEFENKTVVMTYHKLGRVLQMYNNFLDFIDIIILDEVHRIFNYYNIEKSQLIKKAKQHNANITQQEQSVILDIASPMYKVIHSLDKAGKANNYVIAMSATPKLFYEHMDKVEVEIATIETDKQIHAQTVLRQHYYKNIQQAIDRIELVDDDIAILFMTQISHMLRAKEYIEQTKGYRVLCLWSTHNQAHRLSTEQIEAIRYIKETQKVPPGYQVLIINKAYETSINIYDVRIKHFVSHTVNEDSKTQSKGRVRNSVLENLWIKYNNEKDLLMLVLRPYWGVEMGTKEREQITEELNYAFRKDWSWRKWRNWLQKGSFEIIDEKRSGKSYNRIQSKITL